MKKVNLTRLGLERLEDRMAPAVYSWAATNNPTDPQTWATPADWLPNRVPGANDTANFDNTSTIICNVTANTTVGTLNITGNTTAHELALTGGSLTVNSG